MNHTKLVEALRLLTHERRDGTKNLMSCPSARAKPGCWQLMGVLSAAFASYALACAPAPAPVAQSAAAMLEPPGPIRYVIVVTIDGLLPDAYLRPAHYGLEVPVLRDMVARGASSDGALSVFPSLTYPAHTSIASGVEPGRHGVVTNSAFDPLEKNLDAWRWYAEDVKVPTLWDAAYEAGYRTALVDWPATVGVRTATFHVPEFWRAKVPDDVKLIRALSTPGLLESVAEKYPSFLAGFRPQDVADEAGTDIAVHLIDTARPHLVFLHVWQVDAAQHRYGLWSNQARVAIENADRQLGRLLASIEQAGIGPQTALVVASDHGFASVSRCVNPSVLLRRAGLLQVDEQGRVNAWDAAVMPSHGVAYVYVARPGDAALEAATLKVFEDATRAKGSGIGKILSRAEVVALGGDPEAFLGLEAELGTYFGGGRVQYETPPAYAATHGYDPARPEMKAALILFGANIAPGKLVGARLVDIAPTAAKWLGLTLASTDGKPLEIVAGAGVRAGPTTRPD